MDRFQGNFWGNIFIWGKRKLNKQKEQKVESIMAHNILIKMDIRLRSLWLLELDWCSRLHGLDSPSVRHFIRQVNPRPGGCIRSSFYFSFPISHEQKSIFISILTCNKFEVNKSSHWRQQVLRDLQAFWLRSLHEHLLCNGHDRRRLALPDLYILRPDISGLVRDR